jgi:hypothetical protein
MKKFTVELLAPCQVLEAVHTSGKILLDGVWVGSLVNVQMDDGRRFIRIHDYDKPLEAELLAYFGSRKGVSECTFSRPYMG